MNIALHRQVRTQQNQAKAFGSPFRVIQLVVNPDSVAFHECTAFSNNELGKFDNATLSDCPGSKNTARLDILLVHREIF
jgi:hypothetical protein